MNHNAHRSPASASVPQDEAPSQAHSRSHRAAPQVNESQAPAGRELTFKQWILSEAVAMGRAMGGGEGGGATEPPSDPTDPIFCFAQDSPHVRTATNQNPWIAESQLESARRPSPQAQQPAIPSPTTVSQPSSARSTPHASARTPPGSGRARAAPGPGSYRSNGSMEGGGQTPGGISRGGSQASFAEEMTLLPFSGTTTPQNNTPASYSGSPPPSPGDSLLGGATRVLRFDHSKPNRDVGVGAHFEKVVGGSEVRVVRMAERGPAQRSGEVRIGDILLSVNDSQVNGKPMCDLAKLVLGAEGSRVKLELLRGPSKQRFSVVLTRARTES